VSRTRTKSELGIFILHVGVPENHDVLSSKQAQIHLISAALMYISFDDREWRIKLLKELEAAGIKVDFSHIP
jgi:hypothetical protein